jgi:hypothetical protein
MGVVVRSRSSASMVLALGGIFLMGMGLYFVFLRPPLLPEDSRYIGTSLAAIQASVPGLLVWLRRVFWVTGGYMFTSGLLTVHIARTSFQARERGAPLVVALAGLSSIGWMAAVNFLIASDFKWLLLGFALLWPLAFVLFFLKK